MQNVERFDGSDNQNICSLQSQIIVFKSTESILQARTTTPYGKKGKLIYFVVEVTITAATSSIVPGFEKEMFARTV